MKEENLVGKFIIDNGELGLIINKISQGVWNEDPYFSWSISYEIYYFETSNRCIMTKSSLERLINSGKIYLLEKEK